MANDPAAYGALRGSERLIDAMLASGRERKEALRAVSEASVFLRSLRGLHVSAVDSSARHHGRRRRMRSPFQDCHRQPKTRCCGWQRR